jgi:hypothetical protein
MPDLPLIRIVLYKHGVGYFEREATIEGDATLGLTFKQAEVSDVLKSLTVLDLDGGHVASVSYDSTKPLEQLLAEVALSIPDENSLVGLLPQLKGARVAVEPPGSGSLGIRSTAGDSVEGLLLGVDRTERQTSEGVVRGVVVSLLTDEGVVRSFDLMSLGRLEVLDTALRRDLDYYLRTQLSAKKKEARTFTFFAQGNGTRRIRLSYTLEAPVWKATYRILLGEEGQPPLIQGWAVVDNTQDEDWENVELTLVAGLPVSFIHDLYTPRYIRRPVVAVKETTGVVPPEVEEGMLAEFAATAGDAAQTEADPSRLIGAAPASAGVHAMAPRKARPAGERYSMMEAAVSSTPAQVRERKLGDLFEYAIEHPVTIRRNQSALVPIVLRSFEGRPVLLHNKQTRPENPMRCVEFKNTTGLTLEGGPVTVLEGGSYVGEAMLDTLKPDEQRLVPYAVELGVRVFDTFDTHDDVIHRIAIRRGTLHAYHLRIQQTTYTFHNKGDFKATVYLDHLRRTDQWELFDTTEPHEITDNYWRFRFTLSARMAMPFVIKERQTVEESHALIDMDDAWLLFWTTAAPATEQVLRQLLELRRQAAAYEEVVARLQNEDAGIHKEQQRIRENLLALGDRPSEKELRERFVRILGTQEDRLEQIVKEINANIENATRCREQMHALLDGLEYETRL